MGSGVLMLVAPEILSELRIRVESLIFDFAAGRTYYFEYVNLLFFKYLIFIGILVNEYGASDGSGTN
jgi:hypothetical protein